MVACAPARVPPAAAPPDEGVTRRVARNSLWLIAQPLLLNAISVLSTGYLARREFDALYRDAAELCRTLGATLSDETLEPQEA